MNETIKPKINGFLNWLGKYIKTDMVYLATGGFWLTFGQIFANLVSLGLSIAYANLLSQQTFGTFKYFLSMYGFVALLTMPGLASAVTQSVSKGFEGSLQAGIRKRFLWSVLGSVIVFAIALYYFLMGNTLLSVGFLIFGFFMPFMESFDLYARFLDGKKLFRQRVVFEVITNLFYGLAIVGTLFLTKNIFIILAVYFLSGIIPKIFFYRITLKKYQSSFQPDDELDSYGKKLTAFQIVTNASQYLDKILLFTMLGPVQVAVFTFAGAIPERIKYFFRFTSTISMPKFAVRPEEEIKKSLPRKLMFFGLIILLVILVYIAAAPLVFKYIFPQYLSSVFISQIISLTAIYAITYPIGSWLTAHKKVREIFTISLLSLLAGVLTMIVFIPLLGIWGAVIGLAANRLTVISASFYYLYK